MGANGCTSASEKKIPGPCSKARRLEQATQRQTRVLGQANAHTTLLPRIKRSYNGRSCLEDHFASHSLNKGKFELEKYSADPNPRALAAFAALPNRSLALPFVCTA